MQVVSTHGLADLTGLTAHCRMARRAGLALLKPYTVDTSVILRFGLCQLLTIRQDRDHWRIVSHQAISTLVQLHPTPIRFSKQSRQDGRHHAHHPTICDDRIRTDLLGRWISWSSIRSELVRSRAGSFLASCEAVAKLHRCGSSIGQSILAHGYAWVSDIS